MNIYMRKPKKRGKKYSIKNKISRILLVLLLILILTVLTFFIYKSTTEGKIYKIVSENLNEDESALTGGVSFNFDIGGTKQVNQAINDIKGIVEKNLPLDVPKCENIIDSNTGKLDILFIGDGYNSMSSLKSDINKLIDFNGSGVG